jgi:hypothetical protein
MENKKAPSSFVPTLTEIVQSEPVAELANASTPAPEIGAGATPDALVEELLQRLIPKLSSELHTAIRESVDAHMQALLPELASRIEEAVRTAVERASEAGSALKP